MSDDDILLTTSNNRFELRPKAWSVFLDIDEMFARETNTPSIWRGEPTVRCSVHGESRGLGIKMDGKTHGICMKCFAEKMLASGTAELI